MRRTTILCMSLLLTISPVKALAQDCDARCCPKLFGSRFCDPACKWSCEEKNNARQKELRAPAPLPHPPPGVSRQKAVRVPAPLPHPPPVVSVPQESPQSSPVSGNAVIVGGVFATRTFVEPHDF